MSGNPAVHAWTASVSDNVSPFLSIQSSSRKCPIMRTGNRRIWRRLRHTKITKENIKGYFSRMGREGVNVVGTLQCFGGTFYFRRVGREDVNMVGSLQCFGGTYCLPLHCFISRKIVVLIFTVARISRVKYKMCLRHKFYA
jgi:hypothetical protein